MRALMLALALLGAAAGALPAATYHIYNDGSGDYPTIAAAIAAASPGDSILVAPGIFLWAGNTQLDYGGKDIVIAGAGPGVTILDCEDSGQPAVLFTHNESPAAVLRDLTFRNNRGNFTATGLTVIGASPTLANLHLEDFDGQWSENWPPYFRGPALHCEGGAPHIADVVIRGCDYAGGAYFLDGEPTLERVLIEDCSANLSSGGGLFLASCAADLREITIRHCWATGYGGGAACGGLPSATFEDCRFEGNEQVSELGSPFAGGGGLACLGSAPVLRRTVFIANGARDGGGGLQAREGAAPVLEDVLFTECGSSHGGSSIYLLDATASLQGVTITGGGYWLGGHEWNDPSAIICFGSSPSLERVIVAYNNVGVGIWADAASSPAISCSDFYANPDGNYGGALPDQTGLNGNISADPLFCDAPGGDFTLDATSPCLPANNDCHVQMGAFGWGCGVTAADGATPAVFAFLAPQPNPFNPKTTLRFALPCAAAVDLVIVDVGGRRVARPLTGEQLPAGNHAIDWNGRDEAGRALPSGVYFARFAAAGFTAEHKLVLLR